MPNSSSKPIFDPKKPWWQRYWHRLGAKYQFAVYLMIGTAVMNYDIAKIAFRSQTNREYEELWLKTKVRNLNDPKYAYLDEEDPPIPLIKLTPEEQFRAEFRRLVQTDSD